MTYKNNPKPDDRSDNVEKLQDAVQNTIGNIHEAEETMKLSNEKDQQDIQNKNERRREAIEGMREEIKDESAARQDGYQF
ncbi:small acid-soluble spore protein Tlp [Chungangia koreensis]|uniref:Small acid-soluble spore protein Tlp n=1 Tax=Chungangia koreensis TaxID=752657 RepID=A0ABV8XAC1_9LACT